MLEGLEFSYCRKISWNEILAHPSVNISPFLLDQYFICTMLLSINLLSSLNFHPSFYMIDCLIGSVILYPCVLLLDWSIDSSLYISAVLMYTSANPPLLLVRTTGKKSNSDVLTKMKQFKVLRTEIEIYRTQVFLILTK